MPPTVQLGEDLRDAEAAIDAALAALAGHDDVAFAEAAAALGFLRARLEAFFAAGVEEFRAALGAGDRPARRHGRGTRTRRARPVARGAVGTGALRNATHLDWRWARLNAARAAAAILIAGALWLGLGWSSGPTMMASAAPNIALLALRERPSADAMDFVWGVAMATLLGFFYLLWVLPQITGFPLLALWLAPPILVSAALMTSPRLMFVGIAFGVFFITLLAPSNPMIYNPEAFMNNALATIAGAALVSLVYLIVLPVDAQRFAPASAGRNPPRSRRPAAAAQAGFGARMGRPDA